MKKTSIFNLGGNACYIDDDAATVLQEYINHLRAHFGDTTSTDEVMNDIEMRLYEIFTERKRYGMQVVGLQEVNEAIAILGNPEEFERVEENESTDKSGKTDETTDTDEQSESEQKQERQTSTVRKLYRNSDNRIFGGVCSGLGIYFDINEIWIRLLFVGIFLLYGSGILLYLILWLIIPKARTTAQRLEMQGIPPSAENIHDYVTTNGGNVPPKKDGDGCLRFAAWGCGGVLAIGCLPIILALIVGGIAMAITVPSEIYNELLHEIPYLPYINLWGINAVLFHCAWLIPTIIMLVWVYNKVNPNHSVKMKPYTIMAILLVWLAIVITFAVRMNIHINNL